MKDKLLAVLENLDVDYADIRFDEERKTQISMNGPHVSNLATFSPQGGHVRAYVNGAKAIASFSRIEDAETIAHQTAIAARSAADHVTKPIRLASAPVVKQEFGVETPNDPRSITLAEKRDLLDHYNQIALAASDIVMTQFHYSDSYAYRSYANTDGTCVRYEHLISHILGIIVGRRGDAVRQGFFAVGGSPDYGRLTDREDLLEGSLAELDELLSASPILGGNYPIVLDSHGSGIFIHEAFGHRSEADLTMDNSMLRERLATGSEIASPILSVYDDPTLPDRGGSYPIDDEGVLARRTPLILEGRVAGRLHSRETAGEFGESVTGNCRASDAGFEPVIRMSNTVIEGGTTSLDDMIASIDDGYYIAGGAGGQGGIDFTFGARWGRRIENGQLKEMVADVNLSGNLFSTLKAISMIGNDPMLFEYCDCGKGSFDGVQMTSRICAGAPHLKIDEVTIGGASA